MEMTWRDVPRREILELLERTDALTVYSIEHFPEHIRAIARRDLREHVSGDAHKTTLFNFNGDRLKSLKGICGLEIAIRIQRDLGLKTESAMGRQTTFHRIRDAVASTIDAA